jgi:hypothetical protein
VFSAKMSLSVSLANFLSNPCFFPCPYHLACAAADVNLQQRQSATDQRRRVVTACLLRGKGGANGRCLRCDVHL